MCEINILEFDSYLQPIFILPRKRRAFSFTCYILKFLLNGMWTLWWWSEIMKIYDCKNSEKEKSNKDGGGGWERLLQERLGREYHHAPIYSEIHNICSLYINRGFLKARIYISKFWNFKKSQLYIMPKIRVIICKWNLTSFQLIIVYSPHQYFCWTIIFLLQYLLEFYLVEHWSFDHNVKLKICCLKNSKWKLSFKKHPRLYSQISTLLKEQN